MPAHPRVCGENLVLTTIRLRKRGSSPRVRGKRGDVQARSLSAGLIPACAGKTMAWALIKNASTAHPRVCGENDCSRSPAI